MASLARRLGLLALVLVVAGGALSACGTTYTYVTNHSTQTFFKIPNGWKVYNQATIRRQLGLTGTFPFFVAFDASSAPNLQHDLSATPQPWGLARVRDLTADERSTYSFESLQNEIIPLDQINSSGGNVQTIIPGRVLTRGSLRGLRIGVSVDPGNGQAIDFEQAGYVDSATNRSWVLAVGCSPQCFVRERGTIDRILNSWTVREK